MRSAAIALAGACVFTPIAAGKAVSPSPCEGASYIERGRCAELKIDAARAKLNRALGEFRSALTTKFALDEFELEQAAWEKFRQSACQYLSDRELFGTNGPTFDYGECQVKIIEQRIASLQL